MKITNSEEIENWLFEHAQVQGHICDGIKEEINGELVNVAYKDRMTGETINVLYDDKTGGLRQKYYVTKRDGSEIDPEAVYFVLRVDADKHARKALVAYADSIQDENDMLAHDLIMLVKRFDVR